MSDAELNCAIAETLGWKAFKEKRGGYELCITQTPGERAPWEAGQNKEEAKKRYSPVPLLDAHKIGFYGRGVPNFVKDDAQCMALIKRFKLEPRWNFERMAWLVAPSYRVDPSAWNADLNRAISECVAKLHDVVADRARENRT